MSGPVAFETGGSGLELFVKKPGTERVLASATARVGPCHDRAKISQYLDSVLEQSSSPVS